MSVLDKAERALAFLRTTDHSKPYEVQTAAATLGRCLGALGSKPSYTRYYADLLHSAVPTLLALASHDSAEVRLVGDEALNRAVVGGFPFHAFKINITLQNQIDPSKNARWIRAALTRVCLGECWLRPGVGKVRSQAQSLFPKLAQIVRTATPLQLVVETLEGNLPRILSALADYTTDEEIFDLAHELLQHIESAEPAVRRGSVACVAHLCKHRPALVTRVLDSAIEKLWPETPDSNAIQGWFGAIKCLLQLNSLTALTEAEVFTVCDFLELYQLCMHYLESNLEHNGYNAVMECLCCVVGQASGEYRRALLERHPNFPALSKHRKRTQRTHSSLSGGATGVLSSVPTFLSDDMSLSEMQDQFTFTGALHLGSLSQLQTPRRSVEDLTLKTPDSPTSETDFELSTSEQLSRHLAAKLEGMQSEDDEMRIECLEEETSSERDSYLKINMGSVHDDDVPLKYCARLLACKFLLTGSRGGVIPDRNVRVSVKASALNCLSAVLQQYPQAMTLYLDKDADLLRHNISGSSEGADSSHDHTNDFILERNVCYQDSLTDSFGQDLLKSTDSQSHQTSQSQAASKRELYKSAGAESIEQKSSTKDVPSNILDSKNSGPKNDLMISGQSADSTNPNMTISNFTSNSNMTASNDPLSTEYPQTSSIGVLSSSIDLDMKFDHFGESTSNVEIFDALNLAKAKEMRKNNTSEDLEESARPKRPLRRTDEVRSKDFPEESKDNVNKVANQSTDRLEVAEFDNQHMSDIILLLEKHSDPQIRGLVRVTIGSYLFSVLDMSHGDYSRWRFFTMLPKDVSDQITVANLVDIIVKGLSDDIHSCVNHSLTALGKILSPLTKSVHTALLPAILNALVDVEFNSYWLCKVNLCKLYEKMPYERLAMVYPGYHLKSSLIMEVLVRMLADQDQKVRHAASTAIAEIIPKVHPPSRSNTNSILTQLAKEQTDRFNFHHNDLALDTLKRDYFQTDLPEQLRDTKSVTKSDNLVAVVTELVSRLMESSCKYNSQGLLEGLLAVCVRWPPWQHSHGYLNQGIVELCLDALHYCSNPVPVCSTLLAVSTAVYPLEIWDSMQQKPSDIFEKEWETVKVKWHHLQSEKCCQLAEKFLQITLKMLNILVHLIEEINPNVHIHRTGIALPGSPVRRKTQDPIPRRGSTPSEGDDKGSAKKKHMSGSSHFRANFVGQFVNEPFYMKLYDNLRAAYSNHKLNLDQKSSMFCTFMSNVLDALSIQLELATEKEIGPVTEEILYYLKTILPFRADKTVFCVTQLLKCLFGTNMVNQYSDYASVNSINVVNEKRSNFFDDVMMLNAFRLDVESGDSEVSRRSSTSSNVSQKMKLSIESKNPRLALERQLLEKMETFARNKSDRKWNTNKKELERYIRLFEPVVIQALKSYTMQNDIPLQCNVLGLLNQLLTLRVNYCMLDSDQVFIGFLLKQLDLVEQNEIPDSSKLVNSIMTFLVQLSSSKHHSKQLMDIPKLIQLCDGLQASGRRAECASALRPLAARVFWSSRHHSAPHQETSVTREVLFYMLQKTMTSAEVLNMVSCVLALSQEHADSYYRWSELAADALLNLLSQRAIELNTREDIAELERLVDCIYKDVLLEQPRVELVLKILFAQPPEQSTSTLEMKERYLATIMVLLRKILVNIPESEIILTIDYLKASFISPSSIFFNVKTEIDPLHVQNVNENCANLSPDVILVRFLFKMLTYVIFEIDKCNEIECTDFEVESSTDAPHRLIYSVAVNIICLVKHMLHLTNGCPFPLTAKTAQSVLHNEQSGLNTGLYSPEENIPLEKLNVICVRQSYRIPLFTVHWSHLLIRLKFLEQKYWQTLLGYMRNSPLSPENVNKGQMQLSLLQIGCLMAYCEYFVENGLSEVIHLTWLLVNRVHTLVSYYNESVVRDLIEKVHENSSASGLLLQAIAARCQSCIKDEFALSTYRMLFNCHESQSGSLVFLICRIMGKLEPAMASRFTALAVNRIRMLKSLPADKIAVQLSKEDVQVALELLQRDKVHLRHPSLIVELNSLASAEFDLSPLDLSQDRSINPQYIVTTNVDANWLVNQIKSRCCQSSIENTQGKDRLQDLASLLMNLSTEELTQILSCPEFDRRILHSSFVLSCDNYIREFLKVVAVYESREVEKENVKKQRLQQKLREEQVTSNIDSNILNVANSLTKFRKNSESEGSKSQFFIPITDNKDNQFEEKFGNLEISEDEPNEIVIPELPPLFSTALSALEKTMTTIIKLFPKQNRPLSQSENFNLNLEQTIDRYTRRCHQVFQDKLFFQEYCIVQNIISGYLESLHRVYAFLDTLDCDISEKVLENVIPSSVARSIAMLTVISLQYLSFLIKNKKIVQSPVHTDVSFRAAPVLIDKIVVDDVIALTLQNASNAFSFDEIWSELNVESNANRIQSAISCLYAVVKYCVKDTKPITLKKYVRGDDDKSSSDICLTSDKLLTLIEYWETSFYGSHRWRIGQVMGEHCKRPIEMLIVAFARLDLVCNIALIPPLAWPAVDLSGKRENMQKIDLPLQALQDMDVLESFLFRVNLISHWSKKTWEEIWMCLLAALQGNGTHWAVRGVMQLLLSSVPTARRLGRPGSSTLHCPRDYVDDSNGMQRLRGIVVGMPVYGRLYEQMNPERLPFLSNDQPEPYGYGQFNTEYLRLASEISDEASFRVRICLKRVRRKTEIDVNSCLQLLMDVASQMLQPKAPTGLSARCALISCIVNVSDLFTDVGQWYWLAQQLIVLTGAEHKTVTQYCVPSQYLLYGLSKAEAVLEGCRGLSDLSSVYQKLVKWLTSSSAPLRQCALHGCLLQLSCNQQTSAPYRQLVTQLSQTCKQYLSPQYRISLYEQSLYWGVLFKLVELGHTELMNTAVDFLLQNTKHPCADLVVRGITTMIRINVLPKDLKKSIIERLVDNRADYSERHAIQVLMVHLFSADNKLLSPRLTADVSNMDPDVLMTSMERITLLYKVLRESWSQESKTISATALMYFLRETLPPAATLSRVVIEFLECCRETERREMGVLSDKQKWMLRSELNAHIVFEVFQTAVSQSQLPVLSGWIFEALCHLLGGKISDNLLPYCLMCLLFSASSNPHLRKLAHLTFHTLKQGFCLCDRRQVEERRNFCPHSRMSFTDRRLLCIVALHSDFTKAQLDKLRELCEDGDVFEDLLKCLLSA